MAESSSSASQRKLDVISLRMARLDPKVPWGFSVKPPRVVDKVQGGGLADRAGLQSGDHIDEIRGESSPTFFRVNEVINEKHNQLDLTVLREPTVTRIWRPNVTDLTNNQIGNRVQNANERNVKVSLEHQKLQPDQMRGFNSGPRQFGSNLQQKSDNQMKSEVLRMIQENEQHRGQRPQNFANNKGLLPNCFCCGRPIVGVMVTAFDLSLHSDCFQCSTCGTNLANQGHHFLNDKFYCDVHGRQRKVQLGDRLGADKQKSSSAAPLTQQVRPFNSNSVNGNTLPSARRDNKNEEERPFKRVPIDSNEVNRLSSAFTGLRTRGPVTKPQAFNEPSRWTPNDVLGPNTESPKCAECRRAITGSFVKAAGKTYCPEHFNCANGACNRRLIECGFVEENGKKYCEKCFETLIAPDCAKCGLPITAECLNALQKHWHPQCFTCTHCRQSFGNAAFYVENNKPYCERDWNQLFTAKCTSCTFPIEAGDKWVEALGGQFHTNCFNCTICHISLEGQTFYAREGRPFCKSHA